MKTNSSVALALLLALVPPASGAIVSGSLWQVPDAVAANAVPANVPARPADVTFDVNSPLNFSGSTTIAAFLASSLAFNITGAPAVLNSPISDGITSMLMLFTGTVSVTNGQTFTVAHDDGLTLIIGGLTVIGAGGPTSAVTTTATYTGPTGNLPFSLVYGECCGAPGVLQISLPLTSIPEPGSFLLSTGILFLFFGRLLKQRC